jgi:hypothetical protein
MMAESNSYGSLSERQIFRWSYGAVRPEPARAGHKPAGRRGRPGGEVAGDDPRRPAGSGGRPLPGGQARYRRPPLPRPAATMAKARGCSRCILIASAHLTAPAAATGSGTITDHFSRPVIVGWRDYARALPDCCRGCPVAPGPVRRRPGGRAGPGVHLGPRADPSRRNAGRGGYSRVQPRPSAAGGTANGHRSWPERCSVCIFLVTNSNIGPVRPAARTPRRDSCRPATFRCGCASVCWRSCYLSLLAPKVCAPTAVQL